MWRFIITYVFASLFTSVIWATVAPKHSFLDDLGMIGLGFLGIIILGFEIFIRALIPDKEELTTIAKLFLNNPEWKSLFLIIGIAAGAVGAALFFIVGKRSDSIWVAGIPIAMFFVCYMTLQYIIPRVIVRQHL
jgi:hypothetical protein